MSRTRGDGKIHDLCNSGRASGCRDGGKIPFHNVSLVISITALYEYIQHFIYDVNRKIIAIFSKLICKVDLPVPQFVK